MNENSNNNKKKPFVSDEQKQIFIFLFWAFIILFLLPSVIILIFNFIKLVVFGNCKLSEFDWEYYSYQQVSNFYLRLSNWFKELVYRLEH